MESSSKTESQKRVIILPVDASEHSDRALNWYLDHLHKKGDHVGIVNIVEPTRCAPSVIMPLGPLVAVPPDGEALHKQFTANVNASKAVVEKFQSRCEKEGIPCSIHLETAEYGAGQKICDIAKEKGATGIVMGSRGLNFIRRTLMGSVSSYVVNHSKVPVVVTPPDSEQ